MILGAVRAALRRVPLRLPHDVALHGVALLQPRGGARDSRSGALFPSFTQPLPDDEPLAQLGFLKLALEKSHLI